MIEDLLPKKFLESPYFYNLPKHMNNFRKDIFLRKIRREYIKLRAIDINRLKQDLKNITAYSNAIKDSKLDNLFIYYDLGNKETENIKTNLKELYLLQYYREIFLLMNLYYLYGKDLYLSKKNFLYLNKVVYYTIQINNILKDICYSKNITDFYNERFLKTEYDKNMVVVYQKLLDNN